MNLKEAFEYKNFLDGTLNQLVMLTAYDESFCVIEERHLKSKSNPDAEDEIYNSMVGPVVAGKTNAQKIVGMMEPSVILKMIEIVANEINALDEAIMNGKGDSETSIDLLISINKTKRKYLEALNAIVAKRSSESERFGYDYKLNADGMQCQYNYPIKTVTTIDFDRNKVKKQVQKLEDDVRERSYKIDKLMLDIEVQYNPPFRQSDSIYDILEAGSDD